MKKNLLLCLKTYQILSLTRNYSLSGAKDSKQKLMIFFVRYTNNSRIYTGISFLKMSLIYGVLSVKNIYIDIYIRSCIRPFGSSLCLNVSLLGQREFVFLTVICRCRMT